MAEELPLFLGLNDKTVTDIPKTVEKQRYMTSVAPKAANPGKWVEQPRMPIPTGEHAVIECQGKIHSIAGYAKHRVDQNFHQVLRSDEPKSWSLKAPFPLPCNHVAGVSIGTKIYTFGGFVEQNRCPHSKCFVYDAPPTSGRRLRQSRARAAPSRRSCSTVRSTCSAGATCARSSGTRSTIQRPTNIPTAPACAARPARSPSSASAITWASPWSMEKSTPSPAAWIATISTPA